MKRVTTPLTKDSFLAGVKFRLTPAARQKERYKHRTIWRYNQTHDVVEAVGNNLLNFFHMDIKTDGTVRVFIGNPFYMERTFCLSDFEII